MKNMFWQKRFECDGYKWPRGYRLAWVDFQRNQAVVYPFGVHWVAMFIYRLWLWSWWCWNARAEYAVILISEFERLRLYEIEHERLKGELNTILHPDGDGPEKPSFCDLVVYVGDDLKELQNELNGQEKRAEYWLEMYQREIAKFGPVCAYRWREGTLEQKYVSHSEEWRECFDVEKAMAELKAQAGREGKG